MVIQCWALSGVWLLQIELGVQVITSTIVIGALENNASRNKNEFLTITREEASWFGKHIKTLLKINAKNVILVINQIIRTYV